MSTNVNKCQQIVNKLSTNVNKYAGYQVTWDYNNEGAGMHELDMLYTISNQGPSIATAPKVGCVLKSWRGCVQTYVHYFLAC